MVSPLRVQLVLHAQHQLPELVPHLRPELLLKRIHVRTRQLVAAELVDAHLIVVLELALVVFVLHLHSVVAQVDQRVKVAQGLLSAVRADLTVFKELRLHFTFYCRHQALYSDVKLPIFDQEWFLNILLHHPGRVLTAVLSLVQNVFDIITHFDVLPLVAVLAWLDDPHLFGDAFSLLHELFPLILIGVGGVMVDVEGQRKSALGEIHVVLLVIADEVLVEEFLTAYLFVVLEVAEQSVVLLAVFLCGDLLFKLGLQFADVGDVGVGFDECADLALLLLVELHVVVGVLGEAEDIELLGSLLDVDVVAPDGLVGGVFLPDVVVEQDDRPEEAVEAVLALDEEAEFEALGVKGVYDLLRGLLLLDGFTGGVLLDDVDFGEVAFEEAVFLLVGLEFVLLHVLLLLKFLVDGEEGLLLLQLRQFGSSRELVFAFLALVREGDAFVAVRPHRADARAREPDDLGGARFGELVSVVLPGVLDGVQFARLVHVAGGGLGPVSVPEQGEYAAVAGYF